MTEEIKQIYEMQKWSDKELLDELTRPLGGDFQRDVERNALHRILSLLIKINKKTP